MIVVYPFWTGWWWYAGPPRYYHYDTWHGTYSEPAPSVTDDSVYRTYYDYGYGWGQGLRNGESSWDDFVDYLKSYIVNASSTSVTEFRRGFVAGYGPEGQDKFDLGMQDANGYGGEESS